jgi:hypothetical protein
VLCCYVSLGSDFFYCDVRYDFLTKTIFGSSLLPVVCRKAHILFTFHIYVCLFAYSGVQHILCCVFLPLVYPMLPVFLIAPWVFSSVYFQLRQKVFFHGNKLFFFLTNFIPLELDIACKIDCWFPLTYSIHSAI